MRSGLTAKALIFSTAAHEAIGQKRRYTNEPYIVHPIEVAEIVSGVKGATQQMIAAAYLHDVVEDTQVSLDVIEGSFGKTVARYVDQLTDVSKPDDGNRAERKRIDLEHTANASPQAKTIKLADLISNTGSIVRHSPSFAKVYLKEKAALLEVLTEGDAELWERAKRILDDSIREIGDL